MKKVNLLFLFFPLLLVHCTPVKMALTDPQWSARKEYAVENRKPLFKKQQVSFGEFRTQEVNRSWTKGYTGSTGFGIGNFQVALEKTDKKQKLQFSLQDGKGNRSEVFCAASLRTKDLVLGLNRNSALNPGMDLTTFALETDNTFYTRIYTGPESLPWELLLDNMQAQRTKTYTGILARADGNFYTIVPVNKVAGKNGPVSLPFGSVGFEIRNQQNQPVAAVSMLDKGTIYLAEIPAEEKFLLANVCTALLLRPLMD
ncbi:MAG TPA: hypothetical protein VK927_03435, partial [Adhaeribacter sp.]|nr:hypothetical protein [Adhaeribacter sp.]